MPTTRGTCHASARATTSVWRTPPPFTAWRARRASATPRSGCWAIVDDPMETTTARWADGLRPGRSGGAPTQRFLGAAPGGPGQGRPGHGHVRFRPGQTQPLPPSPTSSVVICAYTEARWDDLVAAVVASQTQHRPAHEVIVVIDHNPALLGRAAHGLPGVVLTENIEQRGLSGARNSGLRVATGDVVAFIDDDAYGEPDWLESLVAGYADPSVMAVGGTIDPLWERGRPAWFPREFDWVRGCPLPGMPEGRAPGGNVIGG